MSHIPVLLNEVIEYLDPRPDQDYIDATFGAGGHTAAILKKIGPRGRVLAIDASRESTESGEAVKLQEKFPDRLKVVHGNFADLGRLAQDSGFNGVSGILFDLGLSSDELDDPSRGFSFQVDGPLDMRFDRKYQKTKACDIVNSAGEQELCRIFEKFGEEKFSKRIARVIINARKNERIEITSALFNLITAALPAQIRWRPRDTASRIFQSLRIEVNGELDKLKQALPQAVDLLGGRGHLAVISFHSLEDRIVKRFLAEQAKNCVCPPEFPKCVCGKSAILKVLTKKPVIPGAEEISQNPRSKSAKLRVAEKCLES